MPDFIFFDPTGAVIHVNTGMLIVVHWIFCILRGGKL